MLSIIDVLRHPDFFVPDDVILKIKHFKKIGKKLNLENPVLFSEKMQWIKLYDRQPNYPNLVDKYEVRKYIAETIGEKYLIPIYGVWDTFDEIPFDELPDKFVLKCTHDCGSVFICKDKKTLDMRKAKKHFNKYLVINNFWRVREWAYKDIKPRIIAEKFMVDESGTELKDYKFYCFNGEPKLVNVIYERFADTGAKELFYTPLWERLDMTSGGHVPDPSMSVDRPECLNEMLNLTRIVSADKIHLRVDFYLIHGKIYFGELTFYSCGGFECFSPSHWNKTLGDWLTLPPRPKHATGHFHENR